MTARDAGRQVEAVLDVLAPKVTLPEGFTYASGVENLRVPVILLDYHDQAVRPSEEQLRALAEQIVTAVRAAVPLQTANRARMAAAGAAAAQVAVQLLARDGWTGRQRQVAAARHDHPGWSWAELGASLGMTKDQAFAVFRRMRLHAEAGAS